MKKFYEHSVQYIDLMLLGHSMLSYLHESYGNYIAEFCFEKLINKVKVILEEEIIKESKLKELPKYKEFEKISKKIIEEFDKRGSLLKQGNENCSKSILVDAKRLVSALEGNRFNSGKKKNRDMFKKPHITVEKLHQNPPSCFQNKLHTPKEDETMKNSSSIFLLNSGRNFEDLNEFQKSLIKSEFTSQFLDTFRNENFVTESKIYKDSNKKLHGNWTIESKESLSTSLKFLMKQNSDKSNLNFLSKFTSVSHHLLTY